MSSSKKSGNKGKLVGNSNACKAGSDRVEGPPGWAKDLLSQVKKVNSKIDRLWKKCDEIINHINCMDERRFQTGRKLWNSVAETSSRTNEKFLILHGIKLPDQTGVKTRTTPKTPTDQVTATVEFLKKWFSDKLGVSPEIVNAEVFSKKEGNSVNPPIRIELKSKADRKVIFENVKKLKKQKQKVSICDDLPLAIRNLRNKMVDKLMELKKCGAKLKFRGIDLIADDEVVPPPRHDYRKLMQLTDPKEKTTPDYHTDSDEFRTPERHRKGRYHSPPETSPFGSMKTAPQMHENSTHHSTIQEDLDTSCSETDWEQEPLWFTQWTRGVRFLDASCVKQLNDTLKRLEDDE